MKNSKKTSLIAKTRRVDPELESKINEALKNRKIVMADSFGIGDYTVELKELLALFSQKPKDCFVSDESSICDFNSCGDDWDDAANPDWGSWILEKISLHFGVTATVHETLLAVCERIRSRRKVSGKFLN